jgi:sRNA-binding protein
MLVCFQAAPEGAVKAEALKWENKRLAEAKAKLEAQLRDQQRRLGQMEEAAAARRVHKHGPANGQGGLHNLHTPYKVARLASTIQL